MNALEYYLAYELLATSSFGKIVQMVPNSHCTFMVPELSSELLNGLWVAVVTGVSEQKLANGILEVGMEQLSDHAIIWVKDFRIICSMKDTIEKASIRPLLPPAISLAIGGPTGVGKTTLIRRLRASVIGSRVMQYTAYTTRPPRAHEVDGIDYHFVAPEDIVQYQRNPRYIGFVEARGYWYWSDPVEYFRARWNVRQAVHIFTIAQTHEFLARRSIIPDLRWVWLEASPTEISNRLSRRGDIDIEKSLQHNERVRSQDRTGLVSLELNTELEEGKAQVRNLLAFIQSLEGNNYE